jgi:hypothetical protein
MTRNPVGDNEPFSAVYWSAILNAHNFEGVLSGLDPSLGTGSWDVDYTSGEAIAGGSQVTPSAGTVTHTAADGTNTRVDLITVDSTGTVAVVEGTAAADPLAPDIPAGETLIAAVVLPGGASSLSASNIHDYRVILGVTAYPIAAPDIAANAVGASELANDAVDTAALQNNSVTSAKIVDGTVAPADLQESYYNQASADKRVPLYDLSNVLMRSSPDFTRSTEYFYNNPAGGQPDQQITTFSGTNLTAVHQIRWEAELKTQGDLSRTMTFQLRDADGETVAGLTTPESGSYQSLSTTVEARNHRGTLELWATAGINSSQDGYIRNQEIYYNQTTDEIQ